MAVKLWGADTFSSQCFRFPQIISSSGIADSYGSSIFNFWRSLHTVFLFSIVTAPTSILTVCVRAPFSPYAHKHLWFLVILILVILIGIWWHLIVVLIYISLIINDVFMCILALCMSSLGKTLFRSSHFKIILCVYFFFFCRWLVWVLFLKIIFNFFLFFGHTMEHVRS